VLNERRSHTVLAPLGGRPTGSDKQLTQEREQRIQ